MRKLIGKILHFFDRILIAVCGVLPQPLQRLIRRWHRLLTYGFMGALNTLVDYGLYALLYYPLGAPVGLAQFVGLISGSVCGYLLNSNITFREGRGRTKGQFFQYVGVDVILAVLSGAAMHVMEGRIRMPMILVKVCVTAVVALIHYVVYKKFVFKIQKEDGQ